MGDFDVILSAPSGFNISLSQQAEAIAGSLDDSVVFQPNFEATYSSNTWEFYMGERTLQEFYRGSRSAAQMARGIKLEPL